MSDTGECTRCHARLLTLAAFCNRCGLVVERKSELAVPDDLRRIADRHRYLMRVFVVHVCTTALMALQLPNPDPYVALGGGVLFVITLILVMLSVLSMSDALHYGATVSVLLTTLCLIPILNLIIVLWLSQRATHELRVAGIRVRFLGARKGDVDLIVFVHRCRSCGYDLRGLTSLKCPECGMGFAAPAMTGIG